MNLERVLVRLRHLFLVFGGGLAAIGVLLMGLSSYIDDTSSNMVQLKAEAADCGSTSSCGSVRYTVDTPQPSLTPTATVNVEIISPRPLVDTSPRLVPQEALELDFLEARGTIISNTLTVSPSNLTELSAGQTVTPTGPTSSSLKLSTDLVADESYTSTAQVHPRNGTSTTEREEAVVATNVDPKPLSRCPTNSKASFDLVPVDGPPADHPDVGHGDFNLALRGYELVPESLELVFFHGLTDSDAPQLPGLFQPRRAPGIKSTYRVNNWIWDSGRCGGDSHGCSGPLIEKWDVTMVGLATNPGEAITIPERGAQIFSGGVKAMVLYADERQITLGYTRHDTVAAGYVVHLIGICVDPNLLALYRAQNNVDGWRTSGRLPALRNDQQLGTARGDEIKVAVRDNGSFMDPRSSKDWWRGY